VSTDVLLLAGVAAAIVFAAVLLIEGARRPGYDPIYHTGSELDLGEGGWVQRANFLLMGLGVFAYAVGVNQTLNTDLGAVLLAIFGFGMIVAGVFVPDAVRGYPPGAPSDTSAKPTWQALVHAIVGGPVAFFALFGACLTVAGHLQGAWRLYTVLTAVAGLAMTIWTAIAFQTNAAKTGLIQRGLILVYWSWIVLLGIHLTISPPRP
jgi:vacuolar-type H+-ATPase subunit I/STV1